MFSRRFAASSAPFESSIELQRLLAASTTSMIFKIIRDYMTMKEMSVGLGGLGNVQGRCIVNALCLMVGEEEFLQIAKEILTQPRLEIRISDVSIDIFSLCIFVIAVVY